MMASVSGVIALLCALGSSLAGPAPGPIFPTEDATLTPGVSEAPLNISDEYDTSRNVEFHIHSRSNPVSALVVTPNSSWNNMPPPIDFSLDLAVILHGFTGSVLSKSVTLIRNALLFKHNITVIAVQWAQLAQGPWYDKAAENTVVVATLLANFLHKLENYGLQLDRVHLVGFSLGAHVAGITGSILKGRLGRISGLDPARPGFDTRNSSGRLDSSDAKFVFGLHTGGGFVAILDPVGHVDFYPNGGSNQPHCQTEDVPLVCNHFMAYIYFAESIYTPHAFPSHHCNSWEEFEKEQCDIYEVPMGYHTPNSTRGFFYLRTNSEEPYGLGQVNPVDLDVDQSDSVERSSFVPKPRHFQDSASLHPVMENGVRPYSFYGEDNSSNQYKTVTVYSNSNVSSVFSCSSKILSSASMSLLLLLFCSFF